MEDKFKNNLLFLLLINFFFIFELLWVPETVALVILQKKENMFHYFMSHTSCNKCNHFKVWVFFKILWLYYCHKCVLHFLIIGTFADFSLSHLNLFHSTVSWLIVSAKIAKGQFFLYTIKIIFFNRKSTWKSTLQVSKDAETSGQ